MATESVSIIIKAFDQTQKALRSIQAAFGKLSKVFFNFKTALVAAVGAGGLGLLISNSLKSTDALAKTASKIGVTTEALSKLQYVAGFAGVEINTMNMAIQRLVRRTAEAARGTGEARQAFRDLRINAEEFQQLTLEEQMIRLSNAFADNRGKISELATAFKLFDSEGTAMVNILKMGEDQLRGFFAEAEGLGLVMATDAAKGVEAANDALSKLGALTKGIVMQFTAALAPAIKFGADQLFEFSQSLKPLEGGMRTFAVDAAANFVGFIAATIENFERLLKATRFVVNGMITVLNFLFPVFDAIGFAFDLLINSVKRKLNLLVSATQGIDAALQALGFDKVFDFQRFDLEPVKFVRTELEKVREIDLSGLSGGLRVMEAQISSTRDAAKSLSDTIQGTGEGDGDEDTPSFLDRLGDGFHNLGNTVQDAQKPFDDFATATMNSLRKGFTSLIDGSQKASEAMKNMAKSIINSLIQMFIQYKIVEPMFEALFGGKTGGGGGALGSLFSSIFKRERGGPVSGGRPYIVGERGPELMVPAGNGTVVPNNALGGSGVTVVQNINVTTGVQQTVRAEIANLLPQISNAAKSAVADARMRGGSFSRAMGTA